MIFNNLSYLVIKAVGGIRAGNIVYFSHNVSIKKFVYLEEIQHSPDQKSIHMTAFLSWVLAPTATDDFYQRSSDKLF